MTQLLQVQPHSDSQLTDIDRYAVEALRRHMAGVPDPCPDCGEPTVERPLFRFLREPSILDPRPRRYVYRLTTTCNHFGLETSISSEDTEELIRLESKRK